MNVALLYLPSWADTKGTAHLPQNYLIPHMFWDIYLYPACLSTQRTLFFSCYLPGASLHC